jgi:small conductance mechanosensitive channel
MIAGSAAAAPPSAPTAVAVPGEFVPLLNEIRETTSARDSLATLAEAASASGDELLDELSWQQQLKLHSAVISLAERMAKETARGRDLSAVRKELGTLIGGTWPRYLAQLEHRQQVLNRLRDSSDTVTGAKRLAIESEVTRHSDRLFESYQSLEEVLGALERVGFDISEQRDFITRSLRGMATTMLTRVRLLSRDQAAASVRLSRDAANAEYRYEFEAYKERLSRTQNGLTTVLKLLDRLGQDTTDFRVALISATGVITTDVFRWRVLLGLLSAWWDRLATLLFGSAMGWLFKALVVVLTFLGFRQLARVVRRVVKRAVSHSELSELMRATMVRLSSNAVVLLGFLIILTQLGVHVAPLLAGLGIAGFVVGFAMQSTLANFAAGGMILANQPFDVGDEIEVAGVLGVVQRMGLVSTTILSLDNQRVIIPNSTLMSGVIRNRTAEPMRRVDLVFKVSYADDFEKAERVLRELVEAHADVLKQPAPLVALQNLADSSLDIVVRVWTPTPRYWDVYRDLTRAAKLRLEREGFTIPFSQQDVHLHMDPPAPPPTT